MTLYQTMVFCVFSNDPSNVKEIPLPRHGFTSTQQRYISQYLHNDFKSRKGNVLHLCNDRLMADQMVVTLNPFYLKEKTASICEE